ncbi:ABC transporter permease [Actinomadura sp. KC216]|uniref:ABC transporter permease subunit n=1 Tax=Actinomadura sp. KC216 TaxID=2530370 RepID=UPI00104A479C|nr:ABC transporter permease subunit [Actinomadura sp. KC216]TDB84427.1 ABC transporter permease [Actinomadura sp. KC216]
MIWLTLRQFRVQAAVVFGLLAVLTAALLATGPGLADEYDSGLAACGAGGDCTQFTRLFFNDHQNQLVLLVGVVLFLPGIIGVFWGAPLITREIEHGTHRLVWTQSITRTRWLAAKLGLVGLAAVVAAGLAVLAVSWWSDPIDQAAASTSAARVTPVVFMARGVVPIGYAAFAFALGVSVGILVRRTLPAMAITLVAFVAVQVAVPMLVRPHLVPPVTRTVVITADNRGEMLLRKGEDGRLSLLVQAEGEQASWTLENATVDSSGRKLDEVLLTGAGASACEARPPAPNGEPPDGPPQACFDFIKQQGYRQTVVYHPADHFWPLQRAETGLFAVLTLGLTGFCFYWTRRRLS